MDQGQSRSSKTSKPPVHSSNNGDKRDVKDFKEDHGSSIAGTTLSSGITRGNNSISIAEGSQRSHQQPQSAFLQASQQQITDIGASLANTSINDRDSTISGVSQQMMMQQQQQQQEQLQQVPEEETSGNGQPMYAHLWRDADGDYSSDEETEAESEAMLNKVRVVVRVRPLIKGESVLVKRSGKTSGEMHVDVGRNTIGLHFDARNKDAKTYKFDTVCDGETDQRNFFQSIGVKGMIRQVVNGYHATIFAYGQTGAGKTYTMEGYKYIQNSKGQFEALINQSMANNQVGLVQRCTRALMKKLSRSTNDRRISVSVSFLQLYNEKIYDLLNRDFFKPQKTDKYMLGKMRADEGLKLKWNQYDVYKVENLMTVQVDSVDEILHLYHFGIQNKTMGSHRMNMTSSRSHTVFSIVVEQVLVSNPDNTIISKLQVVDLAGSERQSLVKTEGQAQKESIEINKSLFTLRKVITALTERTQKQNNGIDVKDIYIPYRDSKLTCLLRQSLGGNSTTLMVACLHPSDQYFEENNMTLTYAAKAALIRNRPVKNDDPQTKLIEELKQNVKSLSMELLRANQYIEQICVVSGQSVRKFGLGLFPSSLKLEEGGDDSHYQSSQIAITPKQEVKSKALLAQTRSQNRLVAQSPYGGSAVSSKAGGGAQQIESADYDYLVGQNQELMQTQGNLRGQLQQQAFVNDGLKSDLFQKQLENEDLRQRLQYLETLTGKDSTMIRDQISTETSKVDWAQLLLDEQTDEMIITVSREKIAHELIRLRQENQKLKTGESGSVQQSLSQTGTTVRSTTNLAGTKTSSQRTGVFKQQARKASQKASLYSSGSRSEIGISDRNVQRKHSMPQTMTHQQRQANQSAAEQYLSTMGMAGMAPSNTAKQNRTNANTSQRSNFRQSSNNQNKKRLDPLPPRGAQPKGGSVSGRKSQINGQEMFLNSDNQNMTSVSSHTAQKKSAFSQALDAHKKDYISMVSNTLDPRDSRSETGPSDDRRIEQEYQSEQIQQYVTDPSNSYHTIQHNSSVHRSDDEDIYPYTNPSPQVNKPNHVGGGLQSNKNFMSEYGTDSEVERVAVANLSANSINAASAQHRSLEQVQVLDSQVPKPHVTMRKRNNYPGSSIQEENEDDDE